jgi:glycine cleavage system T protein
MKHTPLYEQHKKLNARFTEFSGWEMPIQYCSIIEEHNAVRNSAGVFDTSHMGTFLVSGANAEKFLSFITLGNILEFPKNKARYSMFLNETGGIKDDIIVYKIDSGFMVVVNAGNLEKDWEWLDKNKPDDVELKNISSEICLLAVQGKKSAGILQELAETEISSMKYFTIQKLKMKNIKTDFSFIARTGYTGEDGFEVFISKAFANDLWEKLINLSVKPCGLGCRDTLRLEACMPLHGHEVSESINPIEADFEKTIKWDNNFFGKSALVKIKDNPLKKTIAFECLSGIARNGNKIFCQDAEVGFVTSGTFSPTLKKAIGMALIDIDADENDLEVLIYNTPRKIKIVSKPFYKRK